MAENITKILKLEEIASWWLVKQLHEKELPVRAILPSLQRGFVWKPEQIELLWDSIVQGFPIGSLLLSEIPPSDGGISIGAVEGKGSDGALENPTHFLLDGQQRATAIALGFNNIWDGRSGVKQGQALWVDLVKLKDADERVFAFRVVTKSHPWGYSKTTPGSRVSAANAREALKFYQLLHGKKVQPHAFDIDEVFPWDAEAPVPLALLISSISSCENYTDDGFQKKVSQDLLTKIEALTIWQKKKNIGDDEWAVKAMKKLDTVRGILEGENDSGFKDLVTGLRGALKNTEVPAPVLTKHLTGSDDAGGDAKDIHNPVFNLFKRINSSGTTLSREDINYSMLKAVWPEAKEAIEDKLMKGCQLAQPARMVSLITRLVMMIEGDKDEVEFKGLQAELSVSQFRSQLQKDDFKKKLVDFCADEGKLVIKNIWELLTIGGYALPKVLAAQISQSADDFMLLLMYWMYRVNEGDGKLKGVINKEKTLGFITAVVWFSPELKKCVAVLIKKMKEADQSSLHDFFNQEGFSELLNGDDKGVVLMLPIPHPDCLKKAIHSQVVKDKEFEEVPIGNDKSSNLWWKKPYMWNHLGGESTPESMRVFFYDKLNNGVSGVNNDQKIRELWWRFFEQVYKNKRFILYAQREQLKSWYDWFDPTQPDQIQDRNRPWDYDHILPYSWAHHTSRVFSELPHLVRIWINANGNFRAWPLELNRSKGNDEIIEDKVDGYPILDTKENVCKASFISTPGKWSELNEVGKDGFNKSGEHWKTFVGISIDRTIEIYEAWYDTLLIDELMPK